MKKDLSVAENEELIALQPQPDPVRVEKLQISSGFFATTYKRTGRSRSGILSVGRGRSKASVPLRKLALRVMQTSDFPPVQIRISTTDSLRLSRTGASLPGRWRTPSSSPATNSSLFGLKPCGKLYNDVDEWLTRMVSTTITSEWAVYLRGSKKFVKDTFHVFDRSVRVGQGCPTAMWQIVTMSG